MIRYDIFVMRPLFVLILFAGFIITSYAQEIPDPVQAKLVSDVLTVKPGESFNLGVLFDIDPGWHIYWKNPGDTGLPTEIDFIVPANYKEGALNWPAPSKFQNSRGGTDYGYEKSVLLWSNIKVPSTAEINSETVIEAEVSWLSCKEICIPGKAILNYGLGISEDREPANATIFSEWQKTLDNNH